MEEFNPFSLAGKTVLVTGASSGIGQATAVSVSKMGANVVINGRNIAKLENTFTATVTDNDIDFVMKANFNGAVLLQAALLLKKKVKKDSSIVFIASKAADYPSPGNAVYSASKGALISYSRCLALEVPPWHTCKLHLSCYGVDRLNYAKRSHVGTTARIRKELSIGALWKVGRRSQLGNLSTF